jgi:hypothetical protein
MELTIRILDPSATVARDVTVRADDSHRIADLLPVLVDVMEWPRTAFDGRPIPYELRRQGDPRALDHATPVAALALPRGGTLILGPTTAT